MGAMADALADRVVLTSDNPRDEDPALIADEVLAGSAGRAGWVRELDRRRAIEAALRDAGSDDVIIIAGKGHETEQELDGATIPFDDAAVARELLG